MKVGFVVECGPGGPEEKVFTYLVKLLRADITPRITTCRGKNHIFKDCDAFVGALLAEGCQRVFVVWDLVPCDPPFRVNKKPSCEKEREYLWAQIAPERRDRTTLLCITHELEAWFLADGGAITKVLEKMSEHPVKPAVPSHKSPSTVKDPKNELKRIFTAHRRREYDGRFHAEKIIREVMDLSKLERVQSFKRFKDRLVALP